MWMTCLKISHVDPTVVKSLLGLLNSKYGKINPLVNIPFSLSTTDPVPTPRVKKSKPPPTDSPTSPPGTPNSAEDSDPGERKPPR